MNLRLPGPATFVELYKCALLTVIAALVALTYIHRPIPATSENLRAGLVTPASVPMVRVLSGSIEVSGSESVEDGYVAVTNSENFRLR